MIKKSGARTMAVAKWQTGRPSQNIARPTMRNYSVFGNRGDIEMSGSLRSLISVIGGLHLPRRHQGGRAAAGAPHPVCDRRARGLQPLREGSRSARATSGGQVSAGGGAQENRRRRLRRQVPFTSPQSPTPQRCRAHDPAKKTDKVLNCHPTRERCHGDRDSFGDLKTYLSVPGYELEPPLFSGDGSGIVHQCSLFLRRRANGRVGLTSWKAR
jgi:hypothetical protein